MADADCAQAHCNPLPPVEICDDAIDNDGDGLIDCADPNCAGSAACCVPSPEDCANGMDEDCDGLADDADAAEQTTSDDASAEMDASREAELITDRRQLTFEGRRAGALRRSNSIAKGAGHIVAQVKFNGSKLFKVIQVVIIPFLSVANLIQS